MILYHQTWVKLVWGILAGGLLARKPEEWKGLLDGIVDDGEPVVWFTDRLKPLGSYLQPGRCYVQVDVGLVSDRENVRPLKVDGWWVHVGDIPPAAVSLVDWRLYRRRKPKFWDGVVS